DEAWVWQLRGYAAEQKSSGANVGLIYRRAVRDDLLLGSNLFLDYEKHGNYDEDFFRGSFGLELRSAQIDLYANRYWAITDPQATDDGEYIYSKDGYDIELAIRPYKDVNISGGVTYYKWLGEFGDADESGLLYNLRFQPLSGALSGFDIELQLGKSYSADLDWGAKVSYKQKIGAPVEYESVRNELTFDARAHFFDPVRREYSQRIVKSGVDWDRPIEIFITVVAGTATVYSDHSDSKLGTVTLTAATSEGGQTFTAATITVNGDRVGSTVRIIATGYYTAVMNESSSVILYDRGRVLEVVTGTVYLARAAGSQFPDVIESGGVTISLLGTELSAGKSGIAPTVKISIDNGIVFASITSASELTVAHYGFDATVLLVEDYSDGLGAGNTITLGCSSARQRDFGKYYNDAFTGCVGDVLLDGFAENSQIALDTNGSALLLSVNSSNRFTVSGESSFLRDWQRYPFSPAYNGAKATLSLVAGAGGNLLYSNEKTTKGTASVSVAASSHIEMDSEGVSVTLYLRAGSISGIGAETIVCPLPKTNALTLEVEEDLVVRTACGEIKFDSSGTKFKISNEKFNINSRATYTITTTLGVDGGDGNYNFVLNKLRGAKGIVSLLNDSGRVATLVLYSPVTTRATYELQARPAASEIAKIVSVANIVIEAVVTDALEFSTSTIVSVFRSELDSGIHLATIGVVGAIGTVTYELQADSQTGAASLTLITDVLKQQAVITLVSAGSITVNNATLTLIAKDSTSTPELNSTISMVFNYSSAQPLAVTAEYNHYGAIVDDHIVINNHYRGVVTRIYNVDNAGEWSGLKDAASRYLYTLSTLTNVVMVATITEQSREAEIRVTGALVTGKHTVNIKISDDHSASADATLTFGIEVVNSLIVDPVSHLAEANSTANFVAATVLAKLGKPFSTPPPLYRYTIVDVAPANLSSAFSIDGDGKLSFAGVNNLTDNVTATVRVNAVDAINNHAEFILSLVLYTPLSALGSDAVTVHRTYTAGDFYTPDTAVSGGKPPYFYDIIGINSANSAINSNNFIINSDSGALRLSTAIATENTVTLTIQVRDSSAVAATRRYDLLVVISDNHLIIDANATVTVRSSDVKTLYTVSANWSDADYGSINYQLGDVRPNSLASMFQVEGTSGAVTLTSPLGNAQTVTTEIIAVHNNILWMPPATTSLHVVVTDPITFIGNVQAVTVTTYEPVNNLLTVNAAGSNGNFSYSITDARFAINASVIDLTATVVSPTVIALTVIATDVLFGDSATLVVSVHVIDPSTLGLNIANGRFTHIINTPGEVGELIASGGFVQGGYQFALVPAHSDFEIIHSGSDSATLSLTANINAVGTRTVTVELSDNHANTANKLLVLTVNLLSVFSHSNLPLPSITVRSELDSNQALATVEVAGAIGAVSFVTTAINPSALAGNLQLGTLAAADGLGAMISLGAAVASPTDISIVLEARDTTSNSFTGSTLTNTVIIAVRDPGALLVSENRNGVIINDYAVHNSNYRGHLATVSVRNSGELSGLATGAVYSYGDNSALASISILASSADASHVVLDIANNANVAAGLYTIDISVDDSHSKTPAVSVPLSIEIVAPLSV
ncbi:MAG: inverse autotransporter beta domain-containing protein, partial [Proteobacteria bacterium]|nr:inverse autotransporter beta domain-containing protein [Pseudomonadota bacterium]